MPTIYVASSNPGKLRDFAHAALTSHLANLEICTLPGLADIPPPPEDEPTFVANARAKALAYAREAHHRTSELAGALVLADDSGLEVDALPGEPGVRSARYAEDFGYNPAGNLSPDQRNNRLLLARLGESPRRTGRYRCALALARCGDPALLVAESEGTLEGKILTHPQGSGGFGYDPLFYIPEAHRTMAELDMDQRLQYSHRGRALHNLLIQSSPLILS